MPVDSSVLLDHLRYSKWASSKLLDFASTAPPETVEESIANSHGGILKTFQHVYYADRVWLGRVTGQPPSSFVDPDPGPSITDLKNEWPVLLDRFIDWASTADPERVIAYKTLAGIDMQSRAWEILLHVVNHGTYHRGQIAAMLRLRGLQPPGTDLIFYYRDRP